MPLPNEDPSDPGLPAPLFADVDAVRGDQLRALCQLVWGNLQYLFDFTGRTTDTLTEGVTNLYFTVARVLASALTGFSAGSNTAIAATDTVLQAFAKTQGQINALAAVTPKAWVRFNGTSLAIASQYNVTSITSLGTGQKRINFTNALADANYSVLITCGTASTDAFTQQGNVISNGTISTSAVDIKTMDLGGTYINSDFISVLIF